jgi:hypothetical protein
MQMVGNERRRRTGINAADLPKRSRYELRE